MITWSYLDIPREIIPQNKIVCPKIEDKILTEYFSSVAKATAFSSSIRECSFKSVWEKMIYLF